ncbi:acyltransferase family protein [Tardiphaga sp. 862_B3_N1_1]|uniref:acyltransferase family protein n=1 Tax=Tardiphaga sp. 862_B3_N1_1 TaxID=3240763 RepID=UPI003F8A4C09
MSDRNAALDRARTFVTLLVLANHAAVAYTAFGRYYPNHYLWSTAPIVDSQRWIGFNILTLFNDTFFMCLMFMLSGLFVWPSLKRKGIGDFLRDRALRLGLPFLAMIFVLMPIAYYASFSLSTHKTGFVEFYVNNFKQGQWFAGPGWFIWYLLFLDLVAIPVFLLAPRLVDGINRLSIRAFERPWLFAAVLAVIAVISYVPFLFTVGAVRWFSWGPLQVQFSRMAIYGVFFFAGMGIGAANIDQGLLARTGALARQWLWWTIAAAASFGSLAFLVNFRRMKLANLTGAPPFWWQSSYGVIYAVACTLICLAVLAPFLRFGQREKSIFDPLRGDAYGIFVLHYIPMLWLQYALLNAPLGAGSKALIAFAGTLAASWAATRALRAIPGVKRVL